MKTNRRRIEALNRSSVEVLQHRNHYASCMSYMTNRAHRTRFTDLTVHRFNHSTFALIKLRDVTAIRHFFANAPPSTA